MSAAKTLPGDVGAHALDALRLFPLPDAVLFPGTLLPLHVFEARYRALVSDALDGDRLLAVALLKDAGDAIAALPPVHGVVGVGRIVHVQPQPDGRFYLLLHGVCRAELLAELPLDRGFRTARARALLDEFPVGGEDALAEPLHTLRTCFLRLVECLPERATELAELLDHVRSPGMLADVLCAAALGSAAARQAALATTSVASRLVLATEAVADLMLKVNSRGDGVLPA